MPTGCPPREAVTCWPPLRPAAGLSTPGCAHNGYAAAAAVRCPPYPPPPHQSRARWPRRYTPSLISTSAVRSIRTVTLTVCCACSCSPTLALS